MNARAEWRRATVEIGPTVSGTSTYAFPTGVDRVLKIWIDAVPWSRIDLNAIKETEAGHSFINYRSGSGVFAPANNSSGTEQIRFYPVPTQSGLTIEAETVDDPPLLVNDSDTTIFPDRVDRGLVHYAAWVAFETIEDNAEQAALHQVRFDEKALILTRLRIGRLGSGPREIPIVGVHV